MWLLWTSVCLAIFSSSLSLASEPHYVITVPKNLVQGTEEKVCATFLDLTGEVDLRIDLEDEARILNVAEQKINTQDHTQCYAFQVPTVEDKQSVWDLQVIVHGDHLNVNQSKKVVIFKTEDVCIIQTDKSTYKPGDTVKFRLIAVNHDFHTINKQYPLVEIIDRNGNRIAQWLDVSTTQGFADFNFHLADEVVYGGYQINIPNACNKYFQVDEYVLKRFEFNIKPPSEVYVTDKSIHLEACGSYIYGKPVEGKIVVSLCKGEYHIILYNEDESSSNDTIVERKCIEIKEKTDTKGCFSKDIQLADFNIEPTKSNQYLEIEAELIEDGTDHNEKASQYVHLIVPRKTIEFVEREPIYHKGFPYHGTVKVNDEKKQPVVNEALTLYVPIYNEQNEDVDHVERVHLVTDSNGIAKFSLDTSDWQSSLTLKVGLSSNEKSEDENVEFGYQHDIPEDFLWVSLFYSKSKSFLSIEHHKEDFACNSDQSVTVDYDIQKSILDSGTDHLHFFYIILTKSGIFTYKDNNVEIKDQADSPNVHGSFPLNFHVDPDFVPGFNILVFSVLPNGETIASATEYNVSPCIQNKVKLSFSEKQVRPGESVNLEVTADAGSLCSVRSVDKGYLLERPHSDNNLLTDATNVLRYAIRKDVYSYLDDDHETHQCPENTTARYSHSPDVYLLFKSSNLQIFTDTEIKKPVKCVPDEISARSHSKKKLANVASRNLAAPAQKAQKDYTRSYFPETWIFELVPVGSEGHTVLNRTTPHSITKWETDAFCLGQTGVASVQDVELTTFQPYFIDLIVPYSVVQGEKFTIKAVVFSYVEECILIFVSLSHSEDLIKDKDAEQSRCVCEGHSHTFTWDASVIKPKSLKIHIDSGSIEVVGECSNEALVAGEDRKKDSVEKTIMVKSKGYEDEDTKTFLIFPTEKPEEFTIKIETPERLVVGSERAHIIVMGDLIANIAVNLKDMVYLPDGCGEQNAAKFSRYAYTLEYLKSTKELTPEQKATIIEALNEGYQKQITYRTENGSYVYFPGGSENIWLTAFVVKSLTGGQKYIFIDESQIQQSVNWLHSKQMPDGCFEEEGDYYNNYLEADNPVARTAYITVALLEHRVVLNGSIVEDALRCLRKSVDSDLSTYTQALLAYAFTLSGDHEMRDKLLKKLDEKAIREDGAKHWGTSWYLEGETASYVVLALLCKETTTKDDLEASGDIVRWIVKQQNPWGGFYSSQDTTVAVQALAKYAKAINYRKGDTTVTIKSKSGFEKVVHVDKSNSMLVQTIPLPEIPGEYIVSATGDGYVYLQSHCHYHALPKETGEGPFSFNVTTEPAACNHVSQKQFDVHIDVKYTGKREQTNMALIILEMVSGYIPDKESVKKLKKNPLVERTEVNAQNISIYLEKITHETVSLVFSMEQEAVVENLQVAVAAVVDYYDPDEFNVVEYSAPCSSVVAHCEVSAAERADCGFSGITKEECEDKGCCFDSSIDATKWCFFHGFKKTENH